MSQQVPKKKILIFIDWFLPGYKAGGPVRSMANMVEYLKEDYAFYIVTRNTDYTDSEPYSSVKSNCWESFADNVKVFYADVALQNNATFMELISEVKPDIAYINGVYSWKFSIMPLIAAKKARLKKVIVATRGMLAQSAVDVKGGKKKLFLKVARMAGLYKNVVFHATNEKEKQDINEVLGIRCKVQVADNLPKKAMPGVKSIEKNRGKLKLVSLARIAPEKNTLFALERLADMQDFNGNIQFDLYGQIYDEDYWQQCLAIIANLPSNIKVEHKGTVDAEMVGEAIQNYHALFMPTRGENFGHVILESLSAGRPVLISDQTPWRGLMSEKSGWDLMLEMREEGKVKEGRDERREVSKKSGNGTWCSVLGTLVEMEQDELDVWCDGARKRAEAFVNNAELKEQYICLFDQKVLGVRNRAKGAYL